MIRTLQASLLTVLLLAAPTLAGAQTAVKSRAGAHAEFGRIVFEAPSSARPRAAIAGRRLEIRFPEAVETDLSGVRRHLFRYLKDVELTSDGRRISATLLQPVRLREAVIDGFYVVDLRNDPDGSLADADTPASPARPAPAIRPAAARDLAAAPTARADAPRVRVRAGEHPGFSRLVFDWRRNVEYSVKSDGEGARILFNREARFDLARVRADLPLGLAGLQDEAAAPAGNAAVRLNFDGERRVRHFRDGPRVVVDILPDHARTAERPKQAPRPPLPAERGARESEKKDAKAPSPAVETLKQAVSRPAAVQTALHRKPDAAAQDAPAPRAADGPEKPETAKAPVPAAVEPAAKAGGHPAAGRPLQLLARDIPPASSRDGDLTLSARAEKSIAFLDFTWTQPTGLAAFERGGALWLVFDRPAAADTVPIARLKAHVRDVTRLAHEDAAIYRLVLRPGWRPAISKDGGSWRVKLWKARAKAPVVPPIQVAASGVRVVVSGVRHVIPVNDPEIGDELLVVPLANANFAVPIARRFVQFRILPTLQGVAMVRRADQVQIEALADGVLVTADNGLAVSAKPKVDEDSALSGQRAGLRQPLYAFWSWSGDPKVSYLDREGALLAELAAAKPRQRQAPRMALAQFYLANAQPGRALGMLDVLTSDDPKQARSALVRGMRGLANYMLGKNDLALKELNSVTVARYPDVVLWRGAARAHAQQFEQAAQDFELASPFIPSVPKAKQAELYRAWIRAAHEIGDRAMLSKVLGEFAALAESEDDKAFVALMEGHRLVAKERHVEALQRFDLAARKGSRKTSAEARVGRIDTRLALKRIGVDEAAEDLDLLRYAWRGDEFEIDLLERLARMQFERGAYRAGLASLRQALSFLPAGEATEKLAGAMTGVFSDLFLNGRADKLDPVEALALYNDFRELTPSGKEGDRMIAKLAERLVAVDLLSEAGDLLEEQIRFRAKGSQRARIGTRLAQIRLMNREPDEATKALERTRSLQLPADLAAERRRIRARIALAKGQHQRALAQISGDASDEGQKIKLDTYWAAKNWTRFASTAYAYLDGKLAGGIAFDDSDKALLPRLATAYRLSGDSDGLNRFRKRFADVMNGTGAASAVEALADRERSASAVDDIRSRAASVADTSAIEALLAGPDAKGG